MGNGRSAGIAGTGMYVPPKVLTNHDLAKMVDTSDEWIRTRSGIVERHIMADDQVTSDMAFEASKRALEAAAVSPADLDLIIIGTLTADQPMPSCACEVQRKLGANRAGATDLSAACTGFIYALTLGAGVICSGAAETVLVVGAEGLSRVTDWTDRGTCVLLADGAGAAVLKPVADGRGVRSTYLRADGNMREVLYIEGGGSKHPSSEETVRKRMHYIRMAGPDVFKWAVKTMEEASLEALRRAGLTLADVDLVIPHQANIRIIEAAAQRLGISRDKFVVNIDRYGNTSTASIPMALDEAVRGGRVGEGDTLLLVGFGGGVTWGAAVIVW